MLYQLSYAHHACRSVPVTQAGFESGSEGAGTVAGVSLAGGGIAPVRDPWWVAAILRTWSVSGPGGGTNTASR